MRNRESDELLRELQRAAQEHDNQHEFLPPTATADRPAVPRTAWKSDPQAARWRRRWFSPSSAAAARAERRRSFQSACQTPRGTRTATTVGHGRSHSAEAARKRRGIAVVYVKLWLSIQCSPRPARAVTALRSVAVNNGAAGGFWPTSSCRSTIGGLWPALATKWARRTRAGRSTSDVEAARRERQHRDRTWRNRPTDPKSTACGPSPLSR